MRCLLIVAMALTACRAPASQSPGSGGGSGLICHTETPTGTNFSREVCRTPEQVEDDRKGARDLLEPRAMPRNAGK